MGDPTNVKESRVRRGKHGAPYGNTNGETHGGEGAIKAIQHGTDFSGLAAKEEAKVRAVVQFAGRRSVMFDNAARLQTVANLYYDAMRKAFESGDFDKIDKVVQRYGWLASSALRAWAAVGVEEEKSKGATIDAATVLASLGGDNGTDND